jgi:hypothetical protein
VLKEAGDSPTLAPDGAIRHSHFAAKHGEVGERRALAG